MAYQIGSGCVSCGACADVCPVGAISQGDDHYVIDANSCLDCGTCSDTLSLIHIYVPCYIKGKIPFCQGDFSLFS